MTVLRLKDMDFRDKRVLIRTGFDVPVNKKGNILDDRRIRVSLPTIKHVLKSGARRIVIATHVGRPENKEKWLMTDKIAEKLSGFLNDDVAKVDGWGKVPDAKIVVLENLRFNKSEKSKDLMVRDRFGKKLSGLADIYVNDAFSVCHRDHASITSIPKFIPGCTGLSVEKEIDVITKAVNNPKKPVVAIIGGVKSDKLNVVDTLLNRVDKILIGGALAFTLLNAQGINVGKSKIDKGVRVYNNKVVLPVDCVIADKFDKKAKSRIVDIDSIDPKWMALDIGPKSIALYKKELKKAKTILWFGPIGVFEMKKFANGTKEIAKFLAKSKAVTIVGGGDSASAVDSLGLTDKMTFVSSGGGASLALVEGKELIGLKALDIR